ncbi:hypothetical protein CKAN_02612000 [Cinnamomum micranthum f. kanehirae]|uniref:Uncharacterized protein n=1 Tax=Cinnamomum micranthum f. kanehirae TaxID=337451 RepID=A0A443Q118_9MAGN|nr:hypothetical protein CKAN_02612000 [Cinnamomum micranthum f. kanehirae]
MLHVYQRIREIGNRYGFSADDEVQMQPNNIKQPSSTSAEQNESHEICEIHEIKSSFKELHIPNSKSLSADYISTLYAIENQFCLSELKTGPDFPLQSVKIPTKEDRMDQHYQCGSVPPRTEEWSHIYGVS